MNFVYCLLNSAIYNVGHANIYFNLFYERGCAMLTFNPDICCYIFLGIKKQVPKPEYLKEMNFFLCFLIKHSKPLGSPLCSNRDYCKVMYNL